MTATIATAEAIIQTLRDFLELYLTWNSMLQNPNLKSLNPKQTAKPEIQMHPIPLADIILVKNPGIPLGVLVSDFVL
jgi:hypothetical protein